MLALCLVNAEYVQLRGNNALQFGRALNENCGKGKGGKKGSSGCVEDCCVCDCYDEGKSSGKGGKKGGNGRVCDCECDCGDSPGAAPVGYGGDDDDDSAPEGGK